jgi:FkbM family methyltransferase
MDWSNTLPPVRRAKLELKCLAGKQIRPSIDVHRSFELIGSDYRVAWAIDPTLISAKSIVYCGGVGRNISFDQELIRRYGVDVHAFDPTPECIQWLAGQSVSDKFRFHPVGLANHDGVVSFNEPANFGGDISRSPFRGSGVQTEVQVRRIPTLMQELGHDHIDLLKIDIEGYEYEVIEDLLRSQVPIRQLLVEFHHRWPEIGFEKTRASLRKLREYGFRVFAVSGLWDEYSLVYSA